MSQIQERGSTHVYKVNRISKEEIDSMAERCVYEEPPFCSAACPLKLDTRAMLRAAAAGDFKKALQLYEKVAPFPLILSMGCEAPCEGVCRLCEVGDGVAVRAAENALARCAPQSRTGLVFRTKKRKTAAVFGSGLFPLFLAGELEKKAYPITVFCEQEDLAAFLHCETPFLDEEAFALELGRLKGKDIDFVFGAEITAKMPTLLAGPAGQNRDTPAAAGASADAHSDASAHRPMNEASDALQAPDKTHLNILNERERELTALIAEGLSNKEIAEKLFLSEGTVRNYLSTVLEKLELRDRTQLAIFYLTGRRTAG